MPVLGITGRMGSGKSTVATILRKQGASVLDADQLSREVTRPKTPGFQQIVQEFGESILNQEGEINREQLAKLVFSEPILLKRVETIVHHEIRKSIQQTLMSLDPKQVLVLDVPLPVKEGFLEFCHQVWLIYANESESIQRVMKRNGWKEQKIKQRLALQPSWEEYKNNADVIIENLRTQEELQEKVLAAYYSFLENYL